jgi:hypothetical protein
MCPISDTDAVGKGVAVFLPITRPRRIGSGIGAWREFAHACNKSACNKIGPNDLPPLEVTMILQTLKKIVRVPEEFARRDRSTNSLLEDIGFPAARAELKASDVEPLLRADQDLVDLWMTRGHDQRFVGGWGIESRDGHYAVISFADGRKIPFQDRYAACAEFLVRYLCFIGDVQARTKGWARRTRAA